MSTKDKPSNDDKIEVKNIQDIKIGIVVSEWNKDITDQLSQGCEQTLADQGVKKENIFKIEVPGAFELPTGCRILDDKYNLDAVIALGCVIKGDTKHDEYINQAVASGIMQLGVLRSKPFVFGLLTTNDKTQALERAGGKLGNKGVESAITALKMAAIKRELKSTSKPIGFS